MLTEALENKCEWYNRLFPHRDLTDEQPASSHCAIPSEAELRRYKRDLYGYDNGWPLGQAVWDNSISTYDELPEDVKQTLHEASSLQFLTLPLLEARRNVYELMYTSFSNGFTYF